MKENPVILIQSFNCFSYLDCRIFMSPSMYVYRRMSPCDMSWISPDHKFWQTCWHIFRVVIVKITKTETRGSWGLTATVQLSPMCNCCQDKASVTHMRVFTKQPHFWYSLSPHLKRNVQNISRHDTSLGTKVYKPKNTTNKQTKNKNFTAHS